MQVFPFHMSRMSKRFNLYQKIISENPDFIFQNGDLLLISSKYLSISEGRVKKLSDVKPGSEAEHLSKLYHIDTKMMELIIRESDEIFGGMYGFVLTSVNGILAPNAGIDKSNIPKGYVVLYPKNPYYSLEILKRKFLVNMGIKIGLILVDSRILPMRKGTVGIALASGGFEPLVDFKGRKDLFGNTLKYTSLNVGDCLSSLATFIMGESDKSIPIILVRGIDITLKDSIGSKYDTGIDSNVDIYIRGLNKNDEFI